MNLFQLRRLPRIFLRLRFSMVATFLLLFRLFDIRRLLRLFNSEFSELVLDWDALILERLSRVGHGSVFNLDIGK